MISRKKHTAAIMERFWKRTARGSIILKQYESSEDAGFLNAVKSVSYRLVKIDNCDIRLTPLKKDETHAGMEIDADAVVFLLISFLEDEGIEISGKDMVNIGGVIEGNGITGGDDYRITDIRESDSYFDKPFHARLILKKLNGVD